MKIFFSAKIILGLILLRFGLFSDSASAATLSVTPSAISNTYTGMITLQAGGLTNGETVVIEKFLDANTNSVIDGGDSLMQSFRVTDNQVSLIGGKTNVSVPGDSNATGSAITTLLNFESIDLEHIVGRYAFKLSSPSGRFTPVTNIFNVTNTAYAQSFTGQVLSNGTATAVANAFVILLGTNQNGNNFVGGVVANNSGNYTINAKPGTYQLATFKSNYVGDFSVLPVTLGAGVIVTNNVNAVPATRTISGRLADEGNTNTPLPGIFMFVESSIGLVAIGFTDTNGNFDVPVTSGDWKVGPEKRDLAQHGYVRGDKVQTNTSAGSVSNINILLPKGTAMFYGSMKDDLGNPFPGFDVSGEGNQSPYDSEGVTDANGNYGAVALAGDWRAELRNDDPRLTNYVFSGGGQTISLTNGQAVLQDFILKLATNRITGSLKDNSNTPISGVRVQANGTSNGTNYRTAEAFTDGSGNYSLNVVNGNWNVFVACGCSDCSDNLPSIYQCPANQNININNGNGVVNFTVFLVQPLQITTTNLPTGVISVNYNVNLQATGGQPPYNWNFVSGSLPPGINFGGGLLDGTPTNSGTFNFTIQVSDQIGNTTNKNLSLTINPALQITTSSLPNGTNGVAYNAQLQGSGGQAPYSWSLPGFSPPLPTFLNLNSDGSITGTPNTNGTFQFTVGVSDGNASVAYSNLSITITGGAAQPLQVTTTVLPGGTTGTIYSNQVSATGGQLPYSWSLTPGSTPLPPGLNLSTSGIISGTPTNGGTFGFFLRVTDASLNTADSDYISITTANPPLSVPSTNLPTGTMGVSYNAQLLATGGQPPYNWALANGSLPVPAGLSLGINGVISGIPTTTGTNSFIVRATDANFSTANRSMTIVINPKPTLSSPLKISSSQFQMRLTGVSNQNYTIQYSTTLTNWISISTNNSPSNSFNILDSNATNGARFYRALIGP